MGIVRKNGGGFPTSEDEIEWTDLNALWGVGNIFNEPAKTFTNPVVGPSSYQVSASFEYEDYGNAASLLNSVFGDDYFSIYLPPYSDSRDERYKYGEKIVSIIPSAFLPYPETDRLYEEDDSAVQAIAYLYDFDVYIAGNVIARDVDGVITIQYSSGGSGPVYDAQNGYFPCILNYDGTEDCFYNIENLRTMSVSLGARYYIQFAKYTRTGGWLGNGTLFFKELFKSGFKEPNKDLINNPYEPVDPSGPGDLPPGTFDDNSDPIPLPSLPTLSAANTGFTRIYNPTLSQVQALARYLWTDETVIETIWNHIKQYFEDPMQAIIGFNLVPVPVPDGGTQNFALMYIDTGVSMTVAANQFVDVDCGSVDLTRYYGSALDQSPYTKVHCFLPYIGMVELNTDEVMGATISVNYRVDIVSGSCVASVLVDGNVLYQYSGHCAITIPFSSADFSSYVNAAIQVAKMVGLGVASGVGAAIESAAVESGEQQTGKTITKRTESRKTVRNPDTGRQITTSTSSRVQTIDLPDSDGGTKASYYGLTPTNIANTVGQVVASKRVVQHSGSFSGNSGYLGVRRPYLIIERPRICLPSNYQSLNGYPAMITMSLGECKGFTRVQQVQLTGLYATNPEQAEILELLKMGVVF